MPLEIEVKLRTEAGEVGALRVLLREIGAECHGARSERNLVFDTRDRQLVREDKLLRLRTTDRGRDGILTYKGPARSGRYKQREEIEQTVAEGDDGALAIEPLLAALGYEVECLYEKRREVWACPGCEVVLDELPTIGWFVEVEAQSEERVREVVDLLGLTGREDCRNYLAILQAEGAFVGEWPRRAEFECGRRQSP